MIKKCMICLFALAVAALLTLIALLLLGREEAQQEEVYRGAKLVMEGGGAEWNIKVRDASL